MSPVTTQKCRLPRKKSTFINVPGNNNLLVFGIWYVAWWHYPMPQRHEQQ